MAGSTALYFDRVVHGWVYDVRSYNPGNTGGYQLLSKGVHLDETRHITVKGVFMGYPQYRGGGGNGYLFVHEGQENLITNSTAERGRHNFTFSEMSASGNVIYKSRAKYGTDATDFHRALSMANLIDSPELTGERLQAFNRGGISSGAGHTTTESVFWNTNATSLASGYSWTTRSEQYGVGYVIGTRGAGADASSEVLTDSNEYREGIGDGINLVPQSLYDDQKAKNTH